MKKGITDIKKIVTLGVLTSTALIIFIVELQFPPLIHIPGVKTGLANTVALFLLFLGGRWKTGDVFILQITRILLAAMFTPNSSAILYSLAAGVVALSAMAAAHSLSSLPIPAVSILGSVCHNITQLLLASFIMGSKSVLFYAPVLVISGIASGLLTGLAVSALYRFYPKFIMKIR